MLTLHSPESIAAYIRVSTYDQKTESQREEIARWLKNHGIAPESIQWFEDKETGKTPPPLVQGRGRQLAAYQQLRCRRPLHCEAIGRESRAIPR
jgi:hypothetical protein